MCIDKYSNRFNIKDLVRISLLTNVKLDKGENSTTEVLIKNLRNII